MLALKSSLKNSEEEAKLKQVMAEVDKEIFEADIERGRLQQNEKRFVDLKRRLQKEIASAQVESQKNLRTSEEIGKEGIPQCERELEDKKEARRNIEREVKALNEGKDNSANQM